MQRFAFSLLFHDVQTSFRTVHMKSVDAGRSTRTNNIREKHSQLRLRGERMSDTNRCCAVPGLPEVWGTCLFARGQQKVLVMGIMRSII